MNQKIIDEIDVNNYIKDLQDFPYHILDAYELTQDVKVSGQFDKIFVCGMGGSGISGDLLKTYMESYGVPVFINKDYNLPLQSLSCQFKPNQHFSNNTQC